MLRSLCLALGALLACAPPPDGAARPPNLVLILADDLGYECIGANGGESYATPHLDALAASGMRFERCHVQPMCTPTRVQLLTGLYNVRNYRGFGELDASATTVAQLLERAGYATAIAGKWQLGASKDLPRQLGFQESCLWQHTRMTPRYANPGLDYDGEPRDFHDGEYGPDLVSEFALDFVARHREQPFFLLYSMILPHAPFQPTPDSPDWDPSAVDDGAGASPRHFAGMVAYMDALVGRLLAKLDELGLREDTLVLFLADNGTHRDVTSRFRGRPYRGGKGRSDARGTHVPLIASWRGRIEAGSVDDGLVASTDLLPTLCAAAGAPLPEPLDGLSFLPRLLGQPARARETLYCWFARDGGAEASFEFAMSATHKLYRDGRLYDLVADPFEERPLAAASPEHAEAARALQAELERYAEARPAALREPQASPSAPPDPREE